MLQGFEESVKAVPHLGGRIIARVLEVGFDIERGNALGREELLMSPCSAEKSRQLLTE